MSNNQPTRRRRSFSLRTLFVLTTVISCWLGWQAKIVRDRRSTVESIVAAGGHAGVFDVAATMPNSRSGRLRFVTEPSIPPPIPWIRRMLGDKGLHYIDPGHEMPLSELIRITALFPEADVITRGAERVVDDSSPFSDDAPKSVHSTEIIDSQELFDSRSVRDRQALINDLR